MKKVDPLPSRSSADKDLPAMGRNSAIKNFAPSAEGHQLGLLEPRRDKEPLVRSLLSTPWVFVASRLQRNADTCATKRVKELVEVTLDPVSGRVVSFTRAGRSYKVDSVVQTWAIECRWWNPSERRSRRFWRVLARGGVWDLTYDRLQKVWHLVGVQD